jgi:hypothetical protein
MPPSLQLLLDYPAPSDKRLTLRLRAIVAALRNRARTRVQRVSPERWVLLVFVVLLAAFFATLLVEPSVGRGGR